MRSPISAVATLLVALLVPPVQAQEKVSVAKARAAALLELNKATKANPLCCCKVCDCEDCDCVGCAEPLAKAQAKALLANRDLFVWAGGAKVQQSIRDAYPDAIHLEVREYKGYSDNRLWIPKGGYDWYWERPSAQSLGSIRDVLQGGRATEPAPTTKRTSFVAPVVCAT